MADCLISQVTKIGECILTQCLWPFLKPHVDYWWCFDSNIQGLRDGIEKLKLKKHSIEQEIERARLRTEIPRPEVREWLDSSIHKLEEARTILPNDNTPERWKLISRYSMGKNAKETAEQIAKLLNDGNFNTIADAAPSPAMGFTCDRSMDFKSRKHIEEQIIDSLKQSSVGMIGICGMGGVGKTTMALRIRRRVMERSVMEENVFEEVVMVTVSQEKDMVKIQDEIAEGLKLELNDKYLSNRAATLRRRLMDIKRKIIIFDDVWKSLDLDSLGVPFESERCKILLTTRSKDVCEKMEAQNIIAMEILTEEEAWILFKDKAGDCVEHSTLLSMAKDVVAECKGLPIALVTVGLALRHNSNIHKWKDSLSQLKKSNPTGFPEVLTDVYKPLKLSYDCLDNNSERDLFLMCCLFPEDFDISVEQLTWYSMGLRLFDDITNIEEARNRTHTLVEKLKSRFLLIDVDKYWRKGLEVKMHDVTRDVAIYIGSKEKNDFLKSLTSIENSSDDNCNWMSVNISNEPMEVPVVLRFPKLRLLMWSSKAFYDISHLSFEGMEDLKVLSFEDVSIGSLPPTLGSQKNLQTLRLFYCEVENISVIGELTSLKILSCYGCENITELPAEIGSLSGLRLLELSQCELLQTIPFGVISSLRRLEELKMRGSFRRWEAGENGKERRNASLRELECLPNLSCLEIEIDDCTLSAQEICLSQNLVKYYIRIGVVSYYYFEQRDYEKVMMLNLPSDIGAVGKWIQKGVRNTELLSLEGDGSNNFNIVEIENLRNLRIRNCSTLQKVDEHTTSSPHFVCNPKDVLFSNLKSITISQCDNLRYLFSVSVARRCLLQLEVLYIQFCKQMEELFLNDVRDDNTDGSIEFPKLKEPSLWNLPKLNGLFPVKDVLFCNLKSIEIWECDNLRYLFSVLVARRCLLQLEVLEIEKCDKLEQVFLNEIRNDNTDGCIEFPKLKKLTLRNLPNLTAFCQGHENIIIKFPILTEMQFEALPSLKYSVFPLSSEIPCSLKCIKIKSFSNLKHLFSGSVARTILLQLEVLEIRSCESMEEVFWNEVRDDNTDGCIEFPKLEKLTLENLPNLAAFCQGLENIIIKFPNLTKLKIKELPKLNSLCPLNSETVVGHDQNTCFHFVCNQKVEIGYLKNLRLASFEDNIRNIWCHQIPNNVFNNLESLEIYHMNGIRSLMSTSIAKNLVSLEYLEIKFCKEMVEVIERDDDDDKQVVDITCLFPNLRQLEISNLDKLRRFWEWNHALKLPLLQVVKIYDCPVIETFTLGSLNTPNIWWIKVNSKEIDDHKDLNDAIRHIWSESQNTSKTDGDRNGNENENKDESKDE